MSINDYDGNHKDSQRYISANLVNEFLKENERVSKLSYRSIDAKQGSQFQEIDD